MICPKCQNKISEGDEFCGYCGQKTKGRLAESGINIDKESQKYKDEEQLNGTHTTKFKGLGGWLILVGIGLFTILIYRFYGFFESISMFLDKDVSIFLDQSSEFYISGLNILLMFELFIEVILGIVIIYLLYLFFSKKKKFRNTYIIFLVILLMLSIIDVVWTYNLMQEMYLTAFQDIAKTSLYVIVWGLYMVKSKRVEATFVE